jgi:2-methylcitrate dehydratase PrpD
MADSQRRWQARVEITLRDGRRLEHYTRAAPGYFLNPMTREQEAEKALDLLAPVLGTKRAQTLIATVWNIEKLKDIAYWERSATRGDCGATGIKS